MSSFDLWIALLDTSNDNNNNNNSKGVDTQIEGLPNSPLEAYLEAIPRNWTIAQLRKKIFQEKLFHFGNSAVETDLLLYYEHPKRPNTNEKSIQLLKPRDTLGEVLPIENNDLHNSKPTILLKGMEKRQSSTVIEESL